MNDNDSSPGPAAAVDAFGIGVCWIRGPVICGACATTATHDQVTDRARERSATKAIAERRRVPRVTTAAATTAVAASSSAGVLVVCCRIGIRAAAASITRGPAGVTAVCQTLEGGVKNSADSGVGE